MTDTNAFFRFIWRANALMIFFAALALGLGLLVTVVGNFILWPNDRGMPAPPPAEGAGTTPDTKPATIAVGPITRAEGAIYQFSLLRRSAERNAGVSLSDIKGYREATTVNVIFFDAASGALRRLFPNDDGVVVEQVEAIEIGSRSNVRARLFGYVRADTDRDGRLTRSDERRYLVTKPDGSGAVTVAENVESLDLMPIASGARTLSFFARKGDQVRYGEIDLESFATGAGREVEIRKP